VNNAHYAERIDAAAKLKSEQAHYDALDSAAFGGMSLSHWFSGKSGPISVTSVRFLRDAGPFGA